MGIDIYARWKGQTKQEADAQITGFSVLHGNVGYLREAYHGSPYATKYLFSEAFSDEPDATRKIPASVLRERLPRTLEIVREREQKVYGQTDEEKIQRVLKSFTDFVDLCERKEKETGEPVEIAASW